MTFGPCPACRRNASYEEGHGCVACGYVTLCDRETMHDEIRVELSTNQEGEGQ
jgi:hypothetical protein